MLLLTGVSLQVHSFLSLVSIRVGLNQTNVKTAVNLNFIHLEIHMIVGPAVSIYQSSNGHFSGDRYLFGNRWLLTDSFSHVFIS